MDVSDTLIEIIKIAAIVIIGGFIITTLITTLF